MMRRHNQSAIIRDLLSNELPSKNLKYPKIIIFHYCQKSKKPTIARLEKFNQIEIEISVLKALLHAVLRVN